MNNLTNVHADLLTELTKYKGGEFVPKRSDLYLKFDDPDCDGGYFEWWSDLRMMFLADTHDAHSHIENAAWRAVRDWCKQEGAGCVVSDVGHTPVGITALWMAPGISFYQPLGNGSDHATALLAAPQTINKGDTR